MMILCVKYIAINPEFINGPTNYAKLHGTITSIYKKIGHSFKNYLFLRISN